MNYEADRVMLAGDWHGNQNWAQSSFAYAERHGIQQIIQCGDFGWWVPGRKTDRYLTVVEKLIADTGIAFAWLDGNHEYFPDRIAWSIDRPSIEYLPRGHRFPLLGRTWMAVGGATSVDKEQRVPGKSWWPQEQLTATDVAHASRPGTVDVILSHDAPAGADIPGVGPVFKGGVRGDWPEHILMESAEHRKLLRGIAEATRPGLIVHGHYHISYRGSIDYSPGEEGRRRRAYVIGLDRDTGLHFDANIIVTASQLEEKLVWSQ